MRLSRRQAWLLVGAAAWTWYVWVTRIWNILANPAHDFGFKAVHTVLAVVSIALLTPVGILGIKALRAASTPPSETPGTSGRSDPVSVRRT
jgi:hypothetical protein